MMDPELSVGMLSLAVLVHTVSDTVTVLLSLTLLTACVNISLILTILDSVR